MTEQTACPVLLSIDVKKNRIRIHKSTLHLIGDPPYVQLLINPMASVVALKAVKRASPKDQTHRVSKSLLNSSSSAEIYSKELINRLNDLVPDLRERQCYRMTGRIVDSEKMAVFSFTTLTPVTEDET